MLVNLTPHAITLYDATDILAELAPAGPPARMTVASRPGDHIDFDGVRWPTVELEFGHVEGLPAPAEGIWLIVSPVVQAAVPDRCDLLVPADLVRDEEGAVIGCRALARPARRAGSIAAGAHDVDATH